MLYQKSQLLIIFLLLFFGCKKSKPEEFLKEKETAQSVINQSMRISGSKIIGASTIEFDFRDIHYKASREKGSFNLVREFIDKSGQYFETSTTIRDVIHNNGFQRFVNDFPMAVLDSMAVKYSASVNSVHYFSVLPYGLNDAAVKKELMKDISAKNKMYSTIKVTFIQDGGGEDFEDVFVYWVNKETDKIDYLAYSYNEDDGKGMRFREAYNERYVEGIRFVDYNNYKPENASISLTNLPELFEKGELKLLSKIELKNITVKLN